MPTDPGPPEGQGPAPGKPAPGQAETLPLPAPSSATPHPFLAPPQAPDEIGRLGPYRVLQRLGAGGMGVVYQAEDTGLQRLVALKAMKPSLAASPEARQRFLREAWAMAALKNEHVVAVHQVGE